MNKIFIILLLLSTTIHAKIDVKTYYENIEGGYIYYADNNEYTPVSIKVSLKLTNLKSSEGNNKVFVIPANTKRFKITVLTTIKKGKYKVSGSTLSNLGIHNNSNYDKDFNYSLPFEKGESFNVYQGYNGSFSHQNENALDFTMPIGTNVVAVRAGIVIKVVDVNYRRCQKKECAKFNNLILVYHKDGTFAEYAHLKQKGAKVKVGEQIDEGQIIAESGNTGWSSGPHLHLVVFTQNIKERKTIKTNFKIDNGKKALLLNEKQTYLKNYD